MISINTNYGGLFASKAASQSQRTLDTAMERLSSGMRINYAKDDAAGQAISTRLTAEVQGLEMASKNAADAQSMIDTAEGGLQETHNLLLRMRELAVQSANGTMNDDDRAATNAEYQQLVSEIDRISDTTAWAGVNILNGDVTNLVTGTGANPLVNSLTFQIGEDGTSAHRIAVDFKDIDTTALGLMGHTNGVDNISGNTDDATMAATVLTSQQTAQEAIARIDVAIKHVSSTRATFGAVSNRLSSTMSNLDQISVNLSSSNGRIQDADFAAETSNLAKGQILQQAATAMLAQANASKQNVLALVR
jgi:flagellin